MAVLVFAFDLAEKDILSDRRFGSRKALQVIAQAPFKMEYILFGHAIIVVQ